MSENKISAIKENFDLAVQNHIENNIVVAENLYNEVLKLDPKHLDTLNNLGIIFTELGEYEKAKSYYEKVIKFGPTYVGAHSNLGILFENLGENQKAINCFEKAIEINPKFINGYKALGVLLKKTGEYQKANTNFEKALNLEFTKSPERGLFIYDAVKRRGFFGQSNLEQVESGSEQLPLLTWPLLDFIKNLDLKNAILHELGSGNSTVWFSNIFKRVESYETNEDWYKTLKPKLKDNVSLKLTTLEKIYECSYNFNSRDWLLIDFAGKRTKFVNKLVNLSDEYIPAQIIFDNAECYRNGAKILNDRGYIEIPFYGFKSGDTITSCTSLFILKNKFNIKSLLNFYYPDFCRKLSNNKWDTIE